MDGSVSSLVNRVKFWSLALSYEVVTEKEGTEPIIMSMKCLTRANRSWKDQRRGADDFKVAGMDLRLACAGTQTGTPQRMEISSHALLSVDGASQGGVGSGRGAVRPAGPGDCGTGRSQMCPGG